METNFEMQKENVETTKWYVLDKEEMSEINGGWHLEYKDGIYQMVEN